MRILSRKQSKTLRKLGVVIEDIDTEAPKGYSMAVTVHYDINGDKRSAIVRTKSWDYTHSELLRKAVDGLIDEHQVRRVSV